MAFMPFQMQARSRQSAPNYTPQLVQQTGSDILGAVLAMLQMKASAADSAANRQLQRDIATDNQDLARTVQEASDKRYREIERPMFDIQTEAHKRGLTAQDVSTAMGWMQQFGGSFDTSMAETLKNLEKPIAAQISAGNSRVSPLLERLRGGTNQYNTGAITGTDFARSIAALGPDIDSLTKEADPFSRAAAARSLHEALSVLEGLGHKDVAAASGDLRRTYGKFFALDPATLRSQLEGQITSDFVLNKNKAMTTALDEVMKIRQGSATLGDVLPGMKRNFLASPLGYGQAVGLLPQLDLSASSIIPTQSAGAMVGPMNAVANFFPNLLRGVQTEQFPISTTAALDMVTQGSIKNTPEYKAQEAAKLMMSPAFMGQPAVSVPTPQAPPERPWLDLEQIIQQQQGQK